MKRAWRGLIALLGGTTAIVATASAAHASVPFSTAGMSIVASCDQNVTAGHFACFALRRADKILVR